LDRSRIAYGLRVRAASRKKTNHRKKAEKRRKEEILNEWRRKRTGNKIAISNRQIHRIFRVPLRQFDLLPKISPNLPWCLADFEPLLERSASRLYRLGMPLLKLETSVAISEEKRKALLSSLSKAVAGTTGKPEQYVMVTVGQSAMLISGKPGDAAFVDIRGIGGLTGETNRKLSQQVCKLLSDSLGIGSDRIYLNFTDVEAGNWGWNGSTFG
jgi:phenylpyruvate tautomerase